MCPFLQEFVEENNNKDAFFLSFYFLKLTFPKNELEGEPPEEEEE